jgi:hypothetical protein
MVLAMSNEAMMGGVICGSEACCGYAEVLAACQYPGYTFIVRETHGGIVLQAKYLDPDIFTETLETQLTRKWLLSPHMTYSEIVQTAFKCILTSMEHRAREHFLYKGRRIFGPHFNVDELHKICDRLDAREG